MANVKLSLPNDKETLVEAVLDAPRDLVFDALTDAKQLAQWWAPHGFDITRCDVDLRVGGRWSMIQRGPDGAEHRFHGEFIKIDRPARIEQTWVYEGAPDASARVTITLDEQGGRTTIRNRSFYVSRAHRDFHIENGMEWGMRQAMARLTLVLGDRTGRLHSARLERTFDAPIEAVWRAWTEGAQIAKWLAPWPDVDAEIKECDARADGKLRFVMSAPDGTLFPEATWTFVIVERPRLLLIDMSEGIFMRATLAPHGKRTKLIVEQLGIPSQQMREVFIGGLTGSLDKMGAIL